MIFTGSQLRSRLGWAALLLAAGWISVGVFPITPVEGDEMAVVNALFAWRHTPADFPGLRYYMKFRPAVIICCAVPAQFSAMTT